MKFIMLINVNIYEHGKIVGMLINVKNVNNCWHFNIYEHDKIVGILTLMSMINTTSKPHNFNIVSICLLMSIKYV